MANRKKGTFGGKRSSGPVAVQDDRVDERDTHPPLKPVGKEQLYLRDAEYETIYATVVHPGGVHGTPESLHPKPQAVRLFEKAIKHERTKLVFLKDGVPAIDKKTGKQKTEKIVTVTDKHRVLFFHGNYREWMSLVMPGNVVLTKDLSGIPSYGRPGKGDSVEPGKKKRDTSHLHKFKRTKPLPDKTPADGKRVFRGTIGLEGVLLDAGDGSRVATVPENKSFKEVAKAHKRELVSNDAATPYAYEEYCKFSNAARDQLKKEGRWHKAIKVKS